MTDWKSLVGAVAPTLATALGGPFAGVAVSTLATALLGREGTPDEVAAAIDGGGMEAVAKLKAAERAFETRLQELRIDLERVHAGDRASAREREAKTGDRWTPRILAMLITAGFFGVLGYMLVRGKPEVGGDALLIMLGALGASWGSVVQYYFGSSSGSSDKTAMLAKKA